MSSSSVSSSRSRKRRIVLFTLFGVAVGVSVTIALNRVYMKTSTNEYCMSCHVHEDADKSWQYSVHHHSKSGVVTDCAACHLPPKGTAAHFFTKLRMGVKDIWGYLTKDPAEIDWEAKSQLEYAQTIVYNESCKECHQELFPSRITDEGMKAHLYYENNEERLGLQCISCHLDAGHYDPNYSHARMEGVPQSTQTGEVFASATPITGFESFTEQIPGTHVSFNMKAIPGGSFLMGSPEDEPFRQDDEGPVRKVTLSPFFIGEVEVTWDMYWAFYAETMSEGRIPPSEVFANNSSDPAVDAISGPTPPFGIPDQGWGGGDRPAITMTHYAAETFCQWLSKKTGKHYRLPTEAEWEYATRGGTQTPYFFPGDPKQLSNEGFWRKIFKADTAQIARYAVYANDSKNRTEEPSAVQANPYGLKNTVGNVMEYCSDWYAPDAYQQLEEGAVDPKGPAKGTEHVVRGGSFSDDAALLRSAARSHTRHDEWLKTDPQQPKSIWWYSDIKPIGFRVVCEYNATAAETAADSAQKATVSGK